MYKYVTADNLETPQTYMYTTYEGASFLKDYRSSRETFLQEHAQDRRTDFDVLLQGLDTWLAKKIQRVVEALRAGTLQGEGKDALEFLVKVFELRKRLYAEYPDRYRPNEASGYRETRHYLLFGGLLVRAYALTGNLKYLNTWLKLDDTLLSLSLSFDRGQNGYVAELLARELEATTELAERQGLTF